MNKSYPISYLASTLWVGFLLAISFMEAPLKFQAPSVTLSIGLEIGRLVFGVLNKIEWVLLASILLALLASGNIKRYWHWPGSAFVILIIQSFFLLPALDAHAEMIINGASPAKDHFHLYYVGLEIAKLLLLITMTIDFIDWKNVHKINS